jgi:hypothetical protein
MSGFTQREIIVVPGAGIEPARPCGREILSYLCASLMIFEDLLIHFIKQAITEHFSKTVFAVV